MSWDWCLVKRKKSHISLLSEILSRMLAEFGNLASTKLFANETWFSVNYLQMRLGSVKKGISEFL